MTLAFSVAMIVNRKRRRGILVTGVRLPVSTVVDDGNGCGLKYDCAISGEDANSGKSKSVASQVRWEGF